MARKPGKPIRRKRTTKAKGAGKAGVEAQRRRAIAEPIAPEESELDLALETGAGLEFLAEHVYTKWELARLFAGPQFNDYFETEHFKFLYGLGNVRRILNNVFKSMRDFIRQPFNFISATRWG